MGEGSERSALEARRKELGAESYVHLPGRVESEELVGLYRRAWVVASTSIREGWGMTISEAGACQTPAIATRIPGHLDAIDHGISGILVDEDGDFERAARDTARRPDAPQTARIGGRIPRRAAHVGGDRSWEPGGSGG